MPRLAQARVWRETRVPFVPSGGLVRADGDERGHATAGVVWLVPRLGAGTAGAAARRANRTDSSSPAAAGSREAWPRRST
jgi:hypothetical protein